jgi:hypothetical protein
MGTRTPAMHKLTTRWLPSVTRGKLLVIASASASALVVVDATGPGGAVVDSSALWRVTGPLVLAAVTSLAGGVPALTTGPGSPLTCETQLERKRQ